MRNLGETMVIEYLDSSLECLYSDSSGFLPHVGNRVFVDERAYEVTGIDYFFNTQICKQNKIRVYIDLIRED